MTKLHSLFTFYFSSFLTIPEIKSADSNNCQSEEERNAEIKKENSGNNSVEWNRGLVPAQGIYLTISLSSSAGNKAGNLVENGNFMLSTGFLGYYPVALPLTSQQKVYTEWKIMNTLISSQNDTPLKNFMVEQNLGVTSWTQVYLLLRLPAS